MKATAHLNFDGKCKEAFSFYEQALGAHVQYMMTYGESPMAGQMPPGTKDYVMHATLAIGDSVVMGADAPPGRYQAPQGFSVALHLTDPAHAERIFQALADGGTTEMPLQETFWAARFGMVVDRYGIPWMINCSNES